ncbi:lipoprotein [Paenibacillus tepidiphilus]|uniref:lipoprotein n=1 Tax=Paenibacillus tepidiphilus TaxID=2608683 RepID=UPI00123B5ABB|nr:hypothetical protein [Paenibacillus tepidiphilus]
MNRVLLLLLLLLTLTACNNTESPPDTKENKLEDPSGFPAADEAGLSAWDFETAYTMCSEALSEYYKAVWNRAEMDLDAYVNNDNLKQYMNKKITFQYDQFLKNKLTDNLVTGVDIGVSHAEFAGGDHPYYYLKLDARVTKDVGSYAEPTEFLVQSLNGKLVIADWYTPAKDSYDSLTRGEQQTINNPEIWNDSEWVKRLGVLTE